MFDAVNRDVETDLQAAVDRERLAAHVDRFAGLRRYPGSDDQWEAAEYVADTLSGYGADVTVHTPEAYVSIPESGTVTVPETGWTADDAITTAFAADTPPGGVSGPLVALDSLADLEPVESSGNAHAGGTEDDDHAAGDRDGGTPVTDAIALVDGLPTPDAVVRLAAAGARGVVFVSPTPNHLHEMIVSPVWGTPSAEDYGRVPDVPVVEVRQAAAERLRSVAAAADHVTVETETTTELRELPCPVATVPGTGTDRFLLVGNHIDGWHEGVTDNATAMAASMELVRLFANDRPARGLVVGFWPGHSMGRYAGSAWYADHRYRHLRENGVGYLHLDLNGLDGADQIWYQDMAEVAAEHRAVLATGSLPLGDHGDDDLLGATDRPGRNSDQSFWGTGLSSMLSGARFSPDHPDAGPVGGGWWWHTTEDTRDKVDIEVLVEETELYAAIVSRFCNSPVVPRDFRETARELERELAAVEPDVTVEAVDFESAYDDLDRLHTNLDRVADALDAAGPGVDGDLEDLQVELGNLLIPALYVREPDHRQEPALDHDLLPGLQVATELPDRDGPERRALEITVQRELNRLCDRLRRANDAVERYLATPD